MFDRPPQNCPKHRAAYAGILPEIVLESATLPHHRPVSLLCSLPSFGRRRNNRPLPLGHRCGHPSGSIGGEDPIALSLARSVDTSSCTVCGLTYASIPPLWMASPAPVGSLPLEPPRSHPRLRTLLVPPAPWAPQPLPPLLEITPLPLSCFLFDSCNC